MDRPDEAVAYSAPVPLLSVLRQTGRIGVPIAMIGLTIGVLTGFFPPWRVLVVILVVCPSTLAFVLAEKRAIGVAVGFVVLVLCGWLLRPVVDVRAAAATDRTYERYFGIDSYEDDVVVTFRNIAVATGTFSQGTWMSSSLYHVKEGGVREINAFTVGRSSNRLGGYHWAEMKFTLALGDRDTASGRMTQLGAAGHAQGGGRSGELTHDVVVRESKFFPARFRSGKRRILYVEGDSGFDVGSAMSVAEFAGRNKGNYLVVELELH